MLGGNCYPIVEQDRAVEDYTQDLKTFFGTSESTDGGSPSPEQHMNVPAAVFRGRMKGIVGMRKGLEEKLKNC